MWSGTFLTAVMLKFFIAVILTPILAEGLRIEIESYSYKNFSDGQIIIQSGDTLELTCVGDTPLRWDYPTHNFSSVEIDPGQTKVGSIYYSRLIISQAYYLDTGYYMCSPADADPTSDVSEVIYVYVEDNNNLLVVNDSIVILTEKQYHNLSIPCRPSSPFVNVTLFINNDPVTDIEFDPRKGFMKQNVTIIDTGHYMCEAVKDDYTGSFYMQVIINPHSETVEKPMINLIGASYVTEGDTITFDCSVQVDLGVIATLDWVPPHPEYLGTGHMEAVDIQHEVKEVPYRQIKEHKRLKIVNVTKKDEGRYICNVTDHSHNVNQNHYDLKVYNAKDKNFLNLSTTGEEFSVAALGTRVHSFVVNIASYPPKKYVKWYNRFNIEIVPDKDDKKYEIIDRDGTSKLTINSLDAYDSGKYRIEVDNGFIKKSLSLGLAVPAVPDVKLIMRNNYYKINEDYNLTCDVIAYKANLTWYYKGCKHFPNCDKEDYIIIPPENYEPFISKTDEVYMRSIIKVRAVDSMNIMCKACNFVDCHSETSPFSVSDVNNGFDITGTNHLVAGETGKLDCGISYLDFRNGLLWEFEDFKGINHYTLENHKYKSLEIKEYYTKLSNHSQLILTNVSTLMSGIYKCRLNVSDSLELEERNHSLIVVESFAPSLINVSFKAEKQHVMLGGELKWECHARGSPEPEIIWYKDGKEVKEDDYKKNKNSKPRVQFSQNNRRITFIKIEKNDNGKYSCLAKNRIGQQSSKLMLLKVITPDQPADTQTAYWPWVIACIVFFFALLFVIMYCRMKNQKEVRKLTLADVGVNRFFDGAVESLNPDLDITEQAHFLPYDPKFEIPRKHVKLGKQLGSGAFGVVLQAELELESDEKKTVAVKMVKENVDETHITALATELKIMIHLGRHINVVNLIGACTGNLGNRELLVIVEYCPFGNLHKFLMKHRDNFINQVNSNTGKIDTTIITSVPKSKYVNLPYINSTSNGSAQVCSQQEDNQTVNSAGTEITSVTTPIGEDGYLICKEPQEWAQNRINENRAKQPISTQDLLCWSFQIARGMEYLASRKVLHGDLAARNILLADNNIVKICDFGLSKNMYKDDNYFKKGKRLLPVKWMALEAIRDRNFSIQSDVWAYGITLWELFSLAMTPYPGLEDVEKLYLKLEEGYRMEMPQYSTKELYNVMLDCWQAKPAARPSFTSLAEKLGDMLEDSVRKHYVDLNDPFLAENSEYLSQQDYLSMLHSPTYANLDRETGEILNPGTSGYVSMRQRRDTDAQEETELRPMLSSVSPGNGSISEVDSIPNSPAATSNPSGNFVSVMEAAAAQSFSNPTYHNLDRPPVNPYMNTPYIVEKEGKPYGLQWNSSNTTAV